MQLLQKPVTSASPTKIVIICLVLLAVVVPAGFQVNRWIVKSRTMTQAQIAEGWRAAGLEFAEHTIRHKENFWKVAREYGVDIDTIVGTNPGLVKLQASLGQTIRVPNQRGVVHVIADNEDLQALSALYKVPSGAIAAMNTVPPKHLLAPGLELFIPGAKPVRLTEAMAARYGLRGIFGSPLPGRITSGMGMRSHPVGGFRGKHTGIDLSAKEGTGIAAAAAGTVVQTGEGEYIGKFVILSHRDAFTTVYGHCSQVLAAPGKTVKKGQIIARSGHTGRVTGPHLHFEIRKNGVPQDPLQYLW